MSVLGTLSESKLFRSKSAIERLSARQAADLLHMHICALTIIRHLEAGENWAKDYSRKTTHNGFFEEWKTNSTDLGILGWALVDERCEFRLASTSSRLLDRLTIDQGLLERWVRSIASSQVDKSLEKRVFTRLDAWLRIEDESLKAIRRLVQDWDHLTSEEAQLAATRLLQLLQHHAHGSEITGELSKVIARSNLHLDGACNPETGEGCGSEVDHAVHKKGNLFANIAGAIAGTAIGYHAGKKVRSRVREDATAGATAASAVAPVVNPIGQVQRRVMPTTIAVPQSETGKRKTSKKKPK